MKNKKLLYSVISIFMLLSIVFGVTYAFFNYTRVGEINNIGTGRINFRSSQSDTLNITNIFPVKISEVNPNTLDALKISIQADTNYNGGEEYLISIVDVSNEVNGKRIPLSYIAEVSNLGTSDEEYFENRGGNTSIYSLKEQDRVYNGKEVLIGYVAKGDTGINGNISIKAFVDAERIAISDTFPESQSLYELNTNMTEEEMNYCIDYVTNTWQYRDDMDQGTTGLTFCQGTGTNYSTTFSEYLEGYSDGFLDADLDYFLAHHIILKKNNFNGTTEDWADGRVVLTTDEWNNLQGNNSLSFKIRVESNEGIWVDNPVKPIDSCIGCKFLYLSNKNIYTAWNTENINPTVLTNITDNYKDVINTSGKNYFLGVKLNSDNQITNGYACGVKDNVPFCIEGTIDGSKYLSNQAILQSEKLWNNTCDVYYDEPNYTGCSASEFFADTSSNGGVGTGLSFNINCYVNPNGSLGCIG